MEDSRLEAVYYSGARPDLTGMLESGRSGMGRRWQLKLLSLLLVLAVAEISLQAFYFLNAGDFLFRRAARPIYVPEPYAGFAVKPNLSFRHRTNEFDVVLHTNSQGFRVSARHEEYDRRKDPSKFRILLLGPSFAFGWGVNYEATFGALLARGLAERGFAPGKPVEVINAGVPAVAPGPQLNWYEHVGKHYHPDLIVQFIYGSMVVLNTRRTGLQVDAQGYLVNDNPPPYLRALNAAKQSALIFYGWTLSRRLLAPAPEIAGAGRDLKVETRFDAAAPAVAEALRFYGDLRSAADSTGARLLILYLPLSYAVHPQDLSRWEHLGAGDIPGQIAFNRSFCEYLNHTGFHCVNTTADLIADAQESGQRLYYWLDIHWTPRGHLVAARSAADYLLAIPQREWFTAESPKQASCCGVLAP